MNTPTTLTGSRIQTGRLFNEWMRAETVAQTGRGSWTLGLVGTRSERFRRVSVGTTGLSGLTILDSGFLYNGDGGLLRLELQGYALGIAWIAWVSWSVLSGCRSRASTRRHAGSRWSTTTTSRDQRRCSCWPTTPPPAGR